MNAGSKVLVAVLTAAAVLWGSGCPRGPFDAIAFSRATLDFGDTTTQLSLDVWNSNPRVDSVDMSITTTSSWMSLDTNSLQSDAPASVSGPYDEKRLTVTVDRSGLGVGQHIGQITFRAEGVETRQVQVRVTRNYDAIEFSNQSLDFERSELPRFLEVWNNNPEVETFTLTVTPSDPWIVVNTQTVTSMGPDDASGPFDKQTVQVTVDRRQLAAGEHTGSILFSGESIVAREVAVSVIQDQDGTSNTLNVVNPDYTYTDPYLIDFSFTLRDEEGNAVIQAPEDFEIVAREGTEEVGSETGVHVQRGAARQLRVALVLDYTLSMQSTDGAIAAMEEAAKNTLLPALNEDALVSVTEFHRDDMDAMEVVPFTFDRNFISAGIDSIQSDFVGGFYSASALFDAVVFAAESFDPATQDGEDRYIIIFTDGDDTSSVATNNDVINAARSRGVRIYAINFGMNTIAPDLVDLTSQTDGTLFTASTISEFDDSFQQIVRDLDGQYTLRWASLARGANPLTPGFTLTLGEDSVQYTAPESFVPADHGGNGVLEGKLRFVVSDNETATTVFLRADYVPRFIREFSIYLQSDAGFTVSAVDGDNNGLFGGWTMTETPDLLNGGVTLFFESPGDPIPFGTFGPMLRVTYDALLAEDAPLFNTVYVDNSLYSNSGGQSFVVEGYENTPPSR